MQVYIYCFLLLLLHATLWYVVSIIKKRNDVADIAWGLAMLLVCVYLFWLGYRHQVAVLLYILIALWAIRLSAHIYLRSRNNKEDFRYKAWREDWGKTFYIRSFLQVYLLQASIAFVLISPVIWVALQPNTKINYFVLVGIIILLFGLMYEAVADYQLLKFTRSKKEKGQIMQSGLWKYSRHPNYFGEILVWWGIFLIALSFSYGWVFMFSPLLITYLLVFVSGVPMLEKRYAGNEKYQVYKSNTPTIIPKFY